MDISGRRRSELSTITTRVSRFFGVRSGQLVTAFQVPFSLICLSLFTALALSTEVTQPALAWAGAVIILAASVLAMRARGRAEMAEWVPAALCAASFVSLALFAGSLGAHGHALTVAALLPATGLAYAYLWRGAAWAMIATLVLIGVNLALDTGENARPDATYYVVLPLVILAMTSICVIVTETWEVQRSVMRADRAHLDQILGERNRTTLLLESMIDSLDSAVVAFDATGQTLLSNASHLYPLSWEGAVGASRRLVFEADGSTPVPPEDFPSELAKGGTTVTERLMWFGPPGPRQRAVLATSRPMNGPDGGSQGVMVIYHDITTLVRAMQVKDDFVETVSHELRTPLTSIIGYLELIRDDHEDDVNLLPDETKDYLTVVDRNAHHLLDLVSDLLTTAKSAADTLKVTRERADLNTLVASAVESAQPRFDSGEVNLAYDLTPLPLLDLDVRRTAQVIDNILSNAFKYTPRGGHVAITTQTSPSGVVLTVTDSGIGMSPEDLRRIFDKFHRARTATDLHIPGIGLGLSISKAIVTAHGGDITITSDLDRGTTVTITLPTPAAGAGVP